MFAVLLIPEFRLQARRRHEESPGEGPEALIDGGAPGTGNTRLLEADAAARAAGVRIGMTPPQAQARCPDIRIHRRSPSSERSAMDALLQWAATLSPAVEETAPGCCTLDLRATPADRGGPDHLARRVADAARVLRLDLRLGTGPTPDVARLAAEQAGPDRHRHAGEGEEAVRAFTRPLPVGALHPEPALADLLARWGIHTIGALLDLPPDGLTERLGPEIPLLRDRVLGRRLRPLRRHTPVEEFEESVDYEPGVERLEAVLFALNRFLGQIVDRLGVLNLATDRLFLRLTFEDGDPHEREFPLPEPTTDSERLLRILHTHLENVRGSSPVVRLTLRAHPAHPRHRQLSLFENDVTHPHQLAETLARLTSLVGNERVGTPRPRDTHRPDAVDITPFRPEQESSTPTPARPEPDAPTETGPGLRRFRPALPATVDTQPRPGGGEHPIRIRCALASDGIRASRGPIRLSGDWWIPDAWETEEWDIELTRGGVLRISRRAGRWTVEGRYG